MEGDLEFIADKRANLGRRRYELSTGAWIWLRVDGKSVLPFDVYAHSPSATKGVLSVRSRRQSTNEVRIDPIAQAAE